MIRKTCVDGLFYTSNPLELEDEISQLITSNIMSGDDIITAGIVPHAGYVYSAKTASYTFNEIAQYTLPETIVVIGPNHTGLGDKLSTTGCDSWDMPMGLVDIDNEFIEELINIDDNATICDIAHIKEHSIEVELPFLQYIAKIQNRSFKLVPIIIGYQEYDLCTNLAKSLLETSEKLNRDILVIASSDMTHYEDSVTAKSKDEKILKNIEDMDTRELINNILEYDITMCGYGPVITAITYSKLQNANSSNVLKYSNSGDVNHDYSSVVGYASAIIKKS